MYMCVFRGGGRGYYMDYKFQRSTVVEWLADWTTKSGIWGYRPDEAEIATNNSLKEWRHILIHQTACRNVPFSVTAVHAL